MENELQKRVQELAGRAALRGIYTQTQFLTQAEQALLTQMRFPVPLRFEGVHPEAERCIAVFGDEEEWGYAWESNLQILKIEPKDIRFAEELTHRDFLGAILNLGVKRECLGDLFLSDGICYLIALETIVPYLSEELKRVRHTAIQCSACPALPEGVGVKTQEQILVAASARADALIAAVWNLSRVEAKDVVEKEKVSVLGKQIRDPSYVVKEGERVSVRGYGRFYFDGVLGETRSGRSRVKVRVFQ